MKNILLVLCFILTASACSTTPKEPTKKKDVDPASIEAKQVAAEQEASFVTEIKFLQKSSKLGLKNKELIKNILVKAKKSGAVEEIKTVSWSDNEYPSENTKKLSKNDRDLARNRNKSIEVYLKSQSKNSQLKVTGYNMAERPNLLTEMIQTTDARVKKSLEMAGIPTTDTAVKIPSKASKSIIMIILK